jgi:hypothetical protein
MPPAFFVVIVVSLRLHERPPVYGLERPVLQALPEARRSDISYKAKPILQAPGETGGDPTFFHYESTGFIIRRPGQYAGGPVDYGSGD